MKILVTGSNGQLGQSFQDESFICSHEFTFLTKEDLDITDRMAVYWHFNSNAYDVCINCAAYTAVDLAEANLYAAEKINYIGTLNLAQECARNGVLFVNYSTDYLFGDNSRYNGEEIPFYENSHYVFACNYGMSKHLGELAVKEESKANYIIIRTSWLFSEYGKNFLKTIKEKIDKGEPMKVVNDQVGCPTCAEDLADATMKLIDKHFKRKKSGKLKRCHETYNFNNGEVMSWYDFAIKIAKVYGKKCVIEQTTTKPDPSKARRPKYSALNIEKYKKATKDTPRSVNDAIIDTLSYLNENEWTTI